jgi:hypothetical protein
MNPALYRILETHYRRKRTTLVILAAVLIVVILIALGWGIASFVDDPPAYRCAPKMRFYASCVDRYYREVGGKMAFFTVVPGIFLVITGFVLWPLREIDNAPLIRIFTSRREEVAWLYPKRTSVRRYGVEVNQIHEVVVGLTNRKRETLTMPTEQEVQEAIRLMAVEAPRAARGYGSDIEGMFLRDPTSVMSSAPMPVRGVPSAPAAPVRMVVAPDCPFSRVDAGVRYLGLAPEGAPAQPIAPGEPASAVWTGRGARVAYTLDPRVYLRVLDLSGTEPERLRNELAGVVGVPAIPPQQVIGMLAGSDPRWTLFGVLAAEALGVGADRDTFKDAVGRLTSHPDPAIAAEATRVGMSGRARP